MTEREFELSRRDLLRHAAQGAALLGAGGLLGVCSSSTKGPGPTTTKATTATALPTPGGTLRAGLSGGSRTDTLDPHNWVNLVDVARMYSLFNPLVDFDLDAHPTKSLAEELTASKDAMRWTIRVKPGIEFHNGKTLSADDVLHSFQRIVNPKSPALGARSLKALDIANAKKIDELTIVIPCLTPFSVLKDVLASYYFSVVPVGFDLTHPIGTGPFKFESFTAGQQSTFVKNKNYWETGLPYIDELVISDFPGEVSQVNVLGSGNVDVIDLISSYSIIAVYSGGNKVMITNGGGYMPFTMRVDRPPFDDIRVRQAFRLICDRQFMLDTVFSGNGKIGNDVFGLRDVVYDSALPQRCPGHRAGREPAREGGALQPDRDSGDEPGWARKRGDRRAPQAAGGASRRHGEPETCHNRRVLRPELPELVLRPGLLEVLPLLLQCPAGHARRCPVQRMPHGQRCLHEPVQAGHGHTRRAHAGGHRP